MVFIAPIIKNRTTIAPVTPVATKAIVFKEMTQERTFKYETDNDLAHICLMILKERNLNPAWQYKPETFFSPEEEKFIQFWETYQTDLPKLLQVKAEELYEDIIETAYEDNKPEWEWYYSVQKLLALDKHIAADYKIFYKGKYVPTAYSLLLYRRNRPHENFILMTLEEE